ncbi:hypothetical protein ABT063_02705 [Streptomyces sp. NPDC002838]|uniref:hypothetical protein n=1 Tax=Streptomyces sp. NPDC002838 TaxID=3154436 RepID=UPI003329A897
MIAHRRVRVTGGRGERPPAGLETTSDCSTVSIRMPVTVKVEDKRTVMFGYTHGYSVAPVLLRM